MTVELNSIKKEKDNFEDVKQNRKTVPPDINLF